MAADGLVLPERYRELVESILREHVLGVETWAYGSRVNGDSHEASDLDLVLRGTDLEPIPERALSDLIDAFEASNIPILIDVHDWARLPASFHEAIEPNYVVLQPGADC